MGFLLFTVSLFLSFILYPIAFVTSIIINFRKAKFRAGINKLNLQMFEIATSIDATGNVVCDDLFNLCLIKHNGYLFGNRKETVSSVLGKNQVAYTLTWVGWLIAGLLDLIDEDHCLKSIDIKI